jgi:TRAP-type C4-dicarboxylate transport system permease small subunit
MASFADTFRRLSQIVYVVAAVLTFLFFLMVLANVVARYVFNAPILIGDEMAFYLFVYFAILGVYYAYITRAHIRVDLVTSHLSERTKEWLGLVTTLFELAIWVVILWQGSFVTYDLVTRTHILHAYTLEVPVVVTFIVVPITALLILVHTILMTLIPRIEQLKQLRRK